MQMSTRSRTLPLVSYESSPSPRAKGESDVKTYIAKLQEDLKVAQTSLKEYKKQIEIYR